jgi:hypothetical protein
MQAPQFGLIEPGAGGLLARMSSEKRREAAVLVAELDYRRSARNCLYWLTRCTRTLDEQAAQAGLEPYRPFPDRDYFRRLVDLFDSEPVVMLTKSRTMMASWLVAGWCAHIAFTRPATRIVFQSRDEERSLRLVQYARVLWEQSTPRCQRAWQLAKPLNKQAYDRLELANGSTLVGIVGSADKVRSEHPTVYVADEAAFMPEFEACWAAAAATRAPHLIALSSVQPSAFCDLVADDAEPVDWPGVEGRPERRSDGVSDPESDGWGKSAPCYGLTLRRTKQGWAVPRVHYAADPALTAETVEALRAKAPTPAYWRQEMEIVPDALEGQLVYPEFSPALHVIDDDQVPPRLTRYMAIDPHPRTPHAMLWAGVDAWGDWYLYRELWPSVGYARAQNVRDDEAESEYTTREYAETIAHFEGADVEWRREGTDGEMAILRPQPKGERIVCRYMDVAGKGFKVSAEGARFESYATRYAKYGISCADPIRWHSKGEDAIRELLRTRQHEVYGAWPRLHVARSCQELILEFQKCRYAPMAGQPGTSEVKQESAQVRTHLLDCLRYLATAKLQWSATLAS